MTPFDSAAMTVIVMSFDHEFSIPQPQKNKLPHFRGLVQCPMYRDEAHAQNDFFMGLLKERRAVYREDPSGTLSPGSKPTVETNEKERGAATRALVEIFPPPHQRGEDLEQNSAVSRPQRGPFLGSNAAPQMQDSSCYNEFPISPLYGEEEEGVDD